MECLGKRWHSSLLLPPNSSSVLIILPLEYQGENGGETKSKHWWKPFQGAAKFHLFEFPHKTLQESGTEFWMKRSVQWKQWPSSDNSLPCRLPPKDRCLLAALSRFPPSLSYPHWQTSLNISSFPMFTAGWTLPSRSAWPASLREYFQDLPYAIRYHSNHLHGLHSFLPSHEHLGSRARPWHLTATLSKWQLSGRQISYP